ncbi:SET domain and MYND-type zinc finger protein [Lachnellula occidentalis]|uniref:SET domain and MYND-type zinc finger protein n=1 Tax=Lachnellula occidentalis TaxID=215460 RepID=A0A8H8UHI2_9HELO|nr:SET domain and MYND-type zinc finger protein [Lachnellula occidentalis]
MDCNHSQTVKDPVLGNGLAASKDLSAGEPIIKISEPFLIVVEKDALERVCSYCLIESDISSLKKCTGCKVVRYCTPICQKADWRLIHKNECSLLQRLPGIPPTPVRALYQALLRYIRPAFEFDSRSASLEHHVPDLKKDRKRWDEIVLQAKGALEFSKTPADKMDMVTRLLCIMATNAFRATLPDDTPIGLCYEPTLALANHSCMPNAFIMFDGRSISLMALNAIKAGEQIFISYVDFTKSRDHRRAELKQRYFFDCGCEKCRHSYTPYRVCQETTAIPSEKLALLYDYKTLVSQAAEREHEIQAMQQGLNDLKQGISVAQSLIDLSKTTASEKERLNFLKQAISDLSLYKNHKLFALPPYPTILDELYLAYIDNEHLTSALIILLFIFLNCDIYNWPQPNHPIRVTRLFTIARLLKYASSLEPANLEQTLPFIPREVLAGIDFIDATHAILILVSELAPLSHGQGTRFMGQVELELREVEEVQRLRGGVGKELQKWQSEGNVSTDGRKIASQIFTGLRTLAGFAFEVIEKQNL